jgi:hypothetical protein
MGLAASQFRVLARLHPRVSRAEEPEFRTSERRLRQVWPVRIRPWPLRFLASVHPPHKHRSVAVSTAREAVAALAGSDIVKRLSVKERRSSADAY